LVTGAGGYLEPEGTHVPWQRLYLATFERGEMERTITPLSLTGNITGDFYHLLP
jgi:hypothetical protein